MKFIVKDCDPITGEVQDDGYQEDYRVPLNLLLTTYTTVLIKLCCNLLLIYLNFS